MKTLVYSCRDFEKSFLEKANHGNIELVFTTLYLNEHTVKLAKDFQAISIFSTDSATASVLEKLYTLGVKYITLRTLDTDYINIPMAHSLGFKIANVPNSSCYAIAEHAVALLLAANRKLILGQNLMQLGDYRLDHLVGFDLHGKTIGIIGTGKIGSAFAKIMHGFGCKLLAFDPNENEDLKIEIHINYTTLYELCVNSDVISIHCSLNRLTNHLFNKVTFPMMKKGVIFINTAHGSIVNTIDLIKALNDGTIAAAGLDVYEHEKHLFFNDYTAAQINDDLYHSLRSYPNVLITGHQGTLTKEALEGIANTTIANLNSWEFNGVSKNEILSKSLHIVH